MSDHILGSNHGNDGIRKKSVSAYETSWMAHWTRTSCQRKIQNYNHLSLKEDNGGKEKLLLLADSEMATGNSMFAKRSLHASESSRVNIVGESLKESPGRPGTDRRNVQPFPMFNIARQRDIAMAYPKVETSSRGCSLKLGDDLFSQKDQQKSYKILEKNSLPFSSHFQYDIGPSSKFFPSGFGRKRPRVQSLMSEHDENALPTPSFEYGEKNFSTSSFSKFSVYEKGPENSMDPTGPVKIFTTADSFQETSGEPSRFSRTTQHFMITEKTDVRVFRESTVSMKLKGKMYHEFLNLFPDLGFHHQQGVKPPPTGSSIDREGLFKIDEVKKSAVCIKNESSAETDTFDMDNFRRNRSSGRTSSTSSKAVEGNEKLKSQSGAEIPDMNLEPPVVPDRGSSMDEDKETGTSRTQSMNAETFLPYTELRTKPNGIESELSNRWIKRLKTRASDSADHGTKSLTKGEAFPGDKMQDFCKETMIATEPEMVKPLGREPMVSENKATNMRSEDITLLHPWIQRWSQNKAISEKFEPGIIREAENSKPTTALDEIQKKQFPSIAALALMGKAFSGFSPSSLRKRGSLTLWNTCNLG